ncbi:DUF3800 domain-containing protein [Streptomyces nojiriensis]|uniref:DUF3800 domain-containing protein n=1 Tax=Streptomyces nojiriensis TaxID=66374 RepID=UPI0016738B91|nr:DUF3800 domain-containing protein [Streptomyces nojiriensis]
MFVDESGTHGGSHAFVLGGIAIHERDARKLHKLLDNVVQKAVRGPNLNAEEFELHVSEMKNAKKPKQKTSKPQKVSNWALIPRPDRLALLEQAYGIIKDFRPTQPTLPMALFGVAVDANFRSGWRAAEREAFAYEVLLNKFDVMLKRNRSENGGDDLGLVIHDRRLVAERDIQAWTREWRRAAGTIGQLRNLADVPLFADSKATRLIQVADLVSYAIWRHYSPDPPKEDYIEHLWEVFDKKAEQMCGMVHYTPSYGSGTCTCRSCGGRLTAEAMKFA